MAIGATASEWVNPSVRPPHIHQLINGVDRYNPQNLEVLHQYLGQQLDHGAYDALANLAILKLYQFNPDQWNYEVVINILVKAMLAVPYPDFRLCLSLLGEAPVANDSTPLSGKKEAAEGAATEAKEETSGPAAKDDNDKVYLAGNLTDALILRLATLSSLLQTARFREFWRLLYHDDDYDDVRGYTSNVARFEEDVRKVVIDAVGSTFKRIGEERLAKYLNLKEGKEIDEFVEGISEDGWKIEKDATSGKRWIIAPANADNEIKAVTVNEEIQFEQLTKLLAQAQPTPLKATS